MQCTMNCVSLEIACLRMIRLNILVNTLKSSIQTLHLNMHINVEDHVFLENDKN